MHGFIFVNYRGAEFVDYHPGDFGNLEIMNNHVAWSGSVPGNITGIFDSSKHQVNLYCENHIQLAVYLYMVNHAIRISHYVNIDYWKNFCHSRVGR